MRPSWSSYFLDLAEMAASRGTCPRLQVGALLVLDNRVIATGFNGAPKGLPHCTDVGCLIIPCQAHGEHCQRAVHAEANLLHQIYWLIEKTDVDPTPEWHEEMVYQLVRNATAYVTHEPCPRCRRELEEVGITNFVHRHPYRSGYAEGDCTL
jgi:dCMP deaminase